MKSKTTVLQILSLMFVSCLILISCKSNVKEPKRVPLHSAPILKGEGEGLREYYLKYPVNILNTIDSNKDIVNLIKFSFEPAQLQEILTTNASGQTPDKVVLNLGLEHVIVSGRIINRWHMIAYGMSPPYGINGGTPLEGSNATGHASIFDNFDEGFKSANIKKAWADDLHKLYDNSNYIMTVDKNNREVKLEGLSFDAAHIQEILTNNASGQIPDKVVFFLGLKHVRGHQINQWHIIAYGSLRGNLLDVSYTYSPGALTQRAESVFDKADPCPPCN